MGKEKKERWIKAYTKLLDHPIINKDPDHFIVFCYLLFHAARQPVTVTYKGENIVLNRGELATSIRQIARKTHVDKSKVLRVLKRYTSETLIETRTERYGQVIAIVSWDRYNISETPTSENVRHRTRIEQEYNNNIYINNSVCVIGQRPHTHPYGKLDNVYLTASEYQDLKATYLDTRKLINKVSLWLTEHERKNHYAVCLKFAESDSWARVKPNEQEQIAAQEREQTPEEKAETARIKNEVLAKIGRIGNGGTQIQ